MPKIKIIIVEATGDYDTRSRFISDSITDWEDISDEDLAFIKKYRYDLQREILGNNWSSSLIILEQDPVLVARRVADLKEIIAAKIKRDADAKAKRSKAAKLSAEKRLQKRKENDMNKLLALAKNLGADVTLP